MSILVIGDSCIDVFVYGKCERLCPDAPVPILVPTKIVENGGMAMNVYDNVKSIFENVDIVTNKKIITKTRYVDQKTNQMMVRVDSENSLLDRIKNIEKIPFNKYEIIILSDYCKGFLEKDDIEFICNNHKNVFIDTKKILGDYCLNAKFIKINELEYSNNINAGINMDKFFNNLIVTLGDRGCKFKDKIYPVEKVDIKDMTGAGDTFISTLAVKFLKNKNYEESIKFANKCSTIIVQHKGVNKIGEYIKNI